MEVNSIEERHLTDSGTTILVEVGGVVDPRYKEVAITIKEGGVAKNSIWLTKESAVTIARFILGEYSERPN